MSHFRRVSLSANAGLILGMLAAHPQSGYDLKQHAEQTLRPFWIINYAQIYPVLRQLRTARLIEAIGTPGIRRRKVYRPTRSGRAALLRWLREPVRYPAVLRDEMLLKLYFGALAAPGEVKGIAAAAKVREQAVLNGIAANRRHLASVREPGERWAEAMTVLNMVEAMHRAYVDSLRPLGRGRHRA